MLGIRSLPNIRSRSSEIRRAVASSGDTSVSCSECAECVVREHERATWPKKRRFYGKSRKIPSKRTCWAALRRKLTRQSGEILWQFDFDQLKLIVSGALQKLCGGGGSPRRLRESF